MKLLLDEYDRVEWPRRNSEAMDHKLTVTIPEEVYQPLVEEALRKATRLKKKPP
jgi:hypothetical protein